MLEWRPLWNNRGPDVVYGRAFGKSSMTLRTGKAVEEMTYLPLLPATKEEIDQIIPWTPGAEVIEAIGGLD